MPKKTALLAQLFMTFMMALLMSGILSGIHAGFDLDWLRAWPTQFLVAWPIAFVLTMICWPNAMKVALALTSHSAAHSVEDGGNVGNNSRN